jgi:hypothetical protein
MSRASSVYPGTYTYLRTTSHVVSNAMLTSADNHKQCTACCAKLLYSSRLYLLWPAHNLPAVPGDAPLRQLMCKGKSRGLVQTCVATHVAPCLCHCYGQAAMQASTSDSPEPGQTPWHQPGPLAALSMLWAASCTVQRYSLHCASDVGKFSYTHAARPPTCQVLVFP